MVFSLYICGKVIKIETEFTALKKQCTGYIIKEPAPTPDYSITISESDITKQQTVLDDGISIIKGFIILPKLAQILLMNENTITMHGSVVVHNNSAYMFTAPSGVGKTTHARLWLDNLKDAFILNGDKPFIQVSNQIIAWGSPWCGSEGESRNQGVELKAICILERSSENSISEISFEQALPFLIKEIGVPDTDGANVRIIQLMGCLKHKVKFYRLNVNNFESNAFHTSYDTLSKL